MGAFKFRGAYNALAQFTPAQRQAGVIAFSSGNHAQAIALSARLLGMPSVIVMPHDAPAAKLAATRGYQQGQLGSEVVLYDRYTEDREAIGQRIAAERGMTLIPPYDHPHVMAGQGTAALELLQDTADGGPLDLLLVCVGGGGLISGCAVAAKHLQPGITVLGVEPEAGNDTQQSLARGEIVHIETPQTIADGAQTQHSGHAHLPGDPAPRAAHPDRQRRAAGAHDALLRRAHEDGGRTHRLPGRRSGAGRRRRPARPARPARRHRRQRRQRRPAALRGLAGRLNGRATGLALWSGFCPRPETPHGRRSHPQHPRRQGR